MCEISLYFVLGEKEKRAEKKEDETKKVAKKSIEKEKGKSETESMEEDEEGGSGELDLKLDDMEQADYEEELNFDCGSTFISDNDADLDDTQEKAASTPKQAKVFSEFLSFNFNSKAVFLLLLLGLEGVYYRANV